MRCTKKVHRRGGRRTRRQRGGKQARVQVRHPLYRPLRVKKQVPEARVKIVKFYADWCGHCNDLNRNVWPAFEQQLQLQPHRHIEVINIEEGNAALSQQLKTKYGFQVRGFPTIFKVVEHTNRPHQIQEFMGERSVPALMAFTKGGSDRRPP